MKCKKSWNNFNNNNINYNRKIIRVKLILNFMKRKSKILNKKIKV